MRPRRLLIAALSIATLVPALCSGLAATLASGSAGGDLDARTLHAFATGGYGDVLRANWAW